MNSIEQILVVTRCIERLTVVGGSLLAIYLGFRLFYVTSQNKSSAEVKGQSFKIKFFDIGPGIFFCAFGMSGLLYSLAQPIHINFPGENIVGASVTSISASSNPVEDKIALKDYGLIAQLSKCYASSTNSNDKILQNTTYLQFKILVILYGKKFAQWHQEMSEKQITKPEEFQKDFVNAPKEWRVWYDTIKDYEDDNVSN